MISKSGHDDRAGRCVPARSKRRSRPRYGKAEAVQADRRRDRRQARRTADACATQEGYATFVIPDDVGGRYSVLTPVGLLPLAAAGISIGELVRGAQDMAKATGCGRARSSENPAGSVRGRAERRCISKGCKIEILAQLRSEAAVRGRVVEAALRGERREGRQRNLPGQRDADGRPALDGTVHPAGRADADGDGRQRRSAAAHV